MNSWKKSFATMAVVMRWPWEAGLASATINNVVGTSVQATLLDAPQLLWRASLLAMTPSAGHLLGGESRTCSTKQGSEWPDLPDRLLSWAAMGECKWLPVGVGPGGALQDTVDPDAPSACKPQACPLGKAPQREVARAASWQHPQEQPQTLERPQILKALRTLSNPSLATANIRQ